MLKDWMVDDCADSILITRLRDSNGGCGYWLAALCIAAGVSACLVHWNIAPDQNNEEGKAVLISFLIFLFGAAAAFLVRQLSLSYGSESWCAKSDYLEVGTHLWFIKRRKIFSDCRLALHSYYDSESQGENLEILSTNLIVVAPTGREYDLQFMGTDSLQQAQEFGSILADRTGWVFDNRPELRSMPSTL